AIAAIQQHSTPSRSGFVEVLSIRDPLVKIHRHSKSLTLDSMEADGHAPAAEEVIERRNVPRSEIHTRALSNVIPKLADFWLLHASLGFRSSQFRPHLHHQATDKAKAPPTPFTEVLQFRRRPHQFNHWPCRSTRGVGKKVAAARSSPRWAREESG